MDELRGFGPLQVVGMITFAFDTTPAPAPASLATEIGIIELDPSADWAGAVLLRHHRHQLVSHALSRVQETATSGSSAVTGLTATKVV